MFAFNVNKSGPQSTWFSDNITSIAIAAFAIGALLNGWMLCHTGIGGDQVILLDLGLSLPNGLSATAKAMSGGSQIPGAFLQVLIGAPLLIWKNVASVKIAIWLWNILACIVAWKALQSTVSRSLAASIFIVYCLSPWRVYHASLIWEPAFVFLPAALHLLSCMKLARQQSFLYSLLLGLVLLITPQLHGGFLALWIITIVLIVRKKLHVQPVGILAGLCLGGITLIPFFMSLMNGSASVLSPTEGYFGKGLLTVAPLLKGIFYWPIMGSLDFAVPLREVVYLREESLSILVVTIRVLQAVGILTIALSVCASFMLLRGKLRSAGQSINDYAIAAIVGIGVSAALSPITLQGWHVVILFLAATIPVSAYLHFGPMWAQRQREKIIVAYAVISITILIIIGFGKPTFRDDPLPKEIVNYPRVQQLLAQ